MRFGIVAEMAGREFEPIHVDVAIADSANWNPESRRTHGWMAFAGVDPADVPVLAIEQHIAEKVHAYLRTYASGASSRVKDLVDLALITGAIPIDAERLRIAVDTTFDVRGGARPESIPRPPDSWSVPFRQMARETDLQRIWKNRGRRWLRCWIPFSKDRFVSGPGIHGVGCGETARSPDRLECADSHESRDALCSGLGRRILRFAHNLRAGLIDGGSVPWWRDRDASGLGGLDPRLLGLLHFGQGLLRRGAESGTRLQVGDVGDVSAVFITEEDVDVIVLHGSPIFRSYRSTRRRNCRI